MSEGIQVIPISEEHIDGFRNCLDIVARERLYLAQVNAPSLEIVNEFIKTNIKNHIPQYVAITGNEIIGWCDVTPLKSVGFTHCGELGMGVHPQFRRKGIGEQLVIKTINTSKEIGLERIELEVYKSNIPAIKLYEKIGFKKEGLKIKGRKIDGKYDDVIEMALFI
jgi:ribosomal protein S18 acetylase RimI-like enzyme